MSKLLRRKILKILFISLTLSFLILPVVTYAGRGSYRLFIRDNDPHHHNGIPELIWNDSQVCGSSEIGGWYHGGEGWFNAHNPGIDDRRIGEYSTHRSIILPEPDWMMNEREQREREERERQEREQREREERERQERERREREERERQERERREREERERQERERREQARRAEEARLAREENAAIAASIESENARQLSTALRESLQEEQELQRIIVRSLNTNAQEEQRRNNEFEEDTQIAIANSLNEQDQIHQAEVLVRNLQHENAQHQERRIGAN